MELPRDDVLDALVTDLVAGQVIRALQLSYGREAVSAAVARGMAHGVYEFEELRRATGGGSGNQV